MRSARSLLAFAVVASTFAAPPARAAFTREPWVQNAAKDTAAVYWEAGSTGGTQTLKWGQGTALDQTATGVQVNALAKVYKAVLTGLPSSTSFSWQVVSNADTSQVGSFVTAPPDDAPQPFKFGVYGDNRTNTSNHAAVVNAMKQQAPDFVVNTGDLADVIVTGFNYNEFFSIEKTLLYDVPIFPVPGNHDIISSYQFGFDRPNYYAFRWANAFFVNISASGADSYASGSAQYNWVEQQLSTASADPTIQWIFAVHHFPVYSSGSTHGSTADMQSSLNPLYTQYHVDGVFNGHDHLYERIEKDGIEYFVAGGGGAPLYSFGTIVTGSQFHLSADSVLTVDIDGGVADFKAFKTDGTMIDSKHIEKGPPVTPTPTPSPTPTGSGTPTPNPTGTPGGGNGANGGCDVGGLDVSAMPMLATLASFGLLLARRRKKA